MALYELRLVKYIEAPDEDSAIIDFQHDYHAPHDFEITDIERVWDE